MLVLQQFEALEQFLKITILTNTYEKAQEFFQDNKDEFREEFSELSKKGSENNAFDGLKWQQNSYVFKWKFFTETFTPINEAGKEETLIRMAQRNLYERGTNPILLQERQEILLELIAHLNTVVKPAEHLIDLSDARVLDQLSLCETSEEDDSSDSDDENS